MTDTGKLCALPHRGRRPLAETGLICEQCVAGVRELLADVGSLWLELPYSGLTLARLGGGNPEVQPPRQDFASEPISLAAMALRSPDTRELGSVARTVRRNGPRLESNGTEIPPLPAVLAAWCSAVSEGRRTEVEASTVTVMAGELQRHLEWIVGQDWVGAFEAELRACRRALASATNQPARRRPICRCPDCGGPVMTDQDRRINDLLAANKPLTEPLPGTLGIADCGKCGKVWSGWTAMRILGRMVEDEARSASPYGEAEARGDRSA